MLLDFPLKYIAAKEVDYNVPWDTSAIYSDVQICPPTPHLSSKRLPGIPGFKKKVIKHMTERKQAEN